MSALSNLSKTFDSILDRLDKGVPVDLLYFNFSCQTLSGLLPRSCRPVYVQFEMGLNARQSISVRLLTQVPTLDFYLNFNWKDSASRKIFRDYKRFFDWKNHLTRLYPSTVLTKHFSCVSRVSPRQRTMRVCVEEQWSEVKHVLSGVSQGSVCFYFICKWFTWNGKE